MESSVSHNQTDMQNAEHRRPANRCNFWGLTSYHHDISRNELDENHRIFKEALMKFKLLSTIAFAAIAPLQALAACTGTGSSAYCWDDSGNTYNVQRLGNTTHVQGNNTSTGSSWSQNSQTIGSMTYHNGQAADGSAWNGTT